MQQQIFTPSLIYIETHNVRSSPAVKCSLTPTAPYLTESMSIKTSRILTSPIEKETQASMMTICGLLHAWYPCHPWIRAAVPIVASHRTARAQTNWAVLDPCSPASNLGTPGWGEGQWPSPVATTSAACRKRERERDGVWMWKGKMLLHVEGEAHAATLIIAERTSIGKLWRRRDRADEFAVVSGVRGAAPQEFACHLCQLNKGHS